MTRQGRGEDQGWRSLGSLQELERRELHLRLHRALALLPGPEHEAIVLRILEKKKTEEVAEIMGIERPTARAHLESGIRRLRRLMESPGDEQPGKRIGH